MKLHPDFLKMLKHHEGVRYRPYRDVVALWTVGVGRLMYMEQYRLKQPQRALFELKPEDDRKFSESEVDKLLLEDVGRFERGVKRLCPVPLTIGQYSGLVSFAFNVGLGNLQRSTLRRKVNRQDFDSAVKEFSKWTRAGGKVWKGLVRRRKDEAELFMS